MSLNWIVEGVPRAYEARRSRIHDVEPLWRAALVEALHNDGVLRQKATARRAQRAYSEIAEPSADRAPVLTAARIMTTPVLSLPADATLEQALALMRERELRHIPVTDGDGALVGMVSDRDLMRAGLVLPAPHDGPEGEHAGGAGDTLLSKVMSRRILTARPEGAVRDVAHVMVEERVSSVPVVDDGRLVGIITSTDILRAVVTHSPLDLWV